MKRQPLVELFYNIYYSCAVYTDELKFEELKNNNNNCELCNALNTILKCNTELGFQVQVQVTLGLTVSQSVSLGVEPHLGPMTRYFFCLFLI
jgi:hypothetical protein